MTDIRLAQARGVTRTVTDSVEEVEKLAKAGWKGDVLVRLLVADGGSKQPFGKKFGAPMDWLPDMCAAARGNGIRFTGFSFHVGSECESPQQYVDAITMCREGEKVLATKGFDLNTIDVGGGFLHNDDFPTVAKAIRGAQFTDAIEWIAEPGRFFAGPTHTLYTTVIGKKPMWPPRTCAVEPAWRITIDESVYGSFSNIPFDHQLPVLERVREATKEEKKTPKTPTMVFGRTCDSGDCIGTMPMYDVKVGDMLKVENMGAYTTVTSSGFNGFPQPEKVYV